MWIQLVACVWPKQKSINFEQNFCLLATNKSQLETRITSRKSNLRLINLNVQAHFTLSLPYLKLSWGSQVYKLDLLQVASSRRFWRKLFISNTQTGKIYRPIGGQLEFNDNDVMDCAGSLSILVLARAINLNWFVCDDHICQAKYLNLITDDHNSQLLAFATIEESFKLSPKSIRLNIVILGCTGHSTIESSSSSFVVWLLKDRG